MKQLGYRKKPITKLRSLSFSVSLLAAIFMSSCIAAVPLIIHYAKSDKGYVSTLDVPASADKVYQTAIHETEARPQWKILKRDDAERFLEITDGVQKASAKATPVGPEKTELVVVADVPRTEEGKEVEKKKEKELSLRVAKVLCDSLGVKCNVRDK